MGFTTHNLLILICVSFVYCFTIPLVDARIRHYRWEVRYEYKSPDCYQKLAITINGRTPGPTIIAARGDTIVVELTNGLLTENVAIHWHGIRQVYTIYVPYLLRLRDS